VLSGLPRGARCEKATGCWLDSSDDEGDSRFGLQEENDWEERVNKSLNLCRIAAMKV
jgi:hypothetical protein